MENTSYSYNPNTRFLQVINARLIFRNFSGVKSPKNRDGKRTFCVVIDDEALAERMRGDGFNVRQWRDLNILTVRCNYRENGSGPKVAINTFANRDGKLVLTSRTECDDSNISRLDNLQYDSVDLSINPYRYERDDGTTGYSAYLNEMYVNVIRSALEERYASMEYPSDDENDDDLPF